MIRYFLLFSLFPLFINSQSVDEELKNVQRLGTYLFQYKQACRIANDTLKAANYNFQSITSYYTYKENGNWKVGFGKYGEASNEYLISYEVIYNPTTGKCSLASYETAVKEKSFYCNASKMERVISKMLDPVNKPYTYTIVPVDSSTWYMYAIPEQTEPGVYRLGGDTRFTINWRTNQIIETKRLHKSILQMPVKNNNPHGTISSAPVSPIPVESDVLYVLSRDFKGIHKIITKQYIFTINDRGEISKLSLDDN